MNVKSYFKLVSFVLPLAFFFSFTGCSKKTSNPFSDRDAEVKENIEKLMGLSVGMTKQQVFSLSGVSNYVEGYANGDEDGNPVKAKVSVDYFPPGTTLSEGGTGTVFDEGGTATNGDIVFDIKKQYGQINILEDYSIKRLEGFVKNYFEYYE